MAVTIKQISEAAGVSRGTVDRVLNGRGRVNEETRERVLATARQMGYTPNLAGKALAARKKSYVIGVLLAARGNPFFDEVVRGVREAEQRLSEYGVRVELATLKGFDAAAQVAALEDMRRRASAVVLNPVAVDEVAAAINETVGQGVPVVTLNTDIERTRRLCYVGSDYTASGRTACGMLGLALPGGGRVLVFSGSPSVLGHRQRVQGFVDEAAARFPALAPAPAVFTQDDEELAHQTALRLLDECPDTRGIYVATAGTAGVCRAVKEAGLAGQVRVVCSDVVPTTRALIEQGAVAAAISQQPWQQGNNAVQRAFDHLLTGAPQPDWIAENQVFVAQNL